LIWLKLLLLTIVSLRATANDCIDFWGNGCSVKVKTKKNKKETKEEKLEKLYKESLNWTPKELSPLEKYVSLHPQDKRALYYLRKYLAERQIRACYLERGLTLKDTSYCDKMKKLWERWVEGKQGETATPTVSVVHRESKKVVSLKDYKFLFFFSYTCSQCQEVLPVVLEKLKDYNLTPIPAISDNAEKFWEWKVRRVPTLIAYNPKTKKAYRLVGVTKENLDGFLKFLER